MQLTLSQVFEALDYPGGRTAAAGPVFSSVATDTRVLAPGALFVALTSQKEDGHRFLPQAAAAGAAGFVVSRDIVPPRGFPVIRVADTTVAYGMIARYWRDRFHIPVIGITGSVGKTSTKELAACILESLGTVVKTEASQNTETGVPKTLLQITASTQAAVVEMGMRGLGQIDQLARIAAPTVGIVTMIGDNHIELLGTKEAIAKAKSELIAALPADGLAVIPHDDTFVNLLRDAASCAVVTFGMSKGSDVTARSVRPKGTGWDFVVGKTKVHLPSPSRHDISNFLAAWSAARFAGVTEESLAHAAHTYQAAPMRMEVIKTGTHGTILNDAYNAAPASVESALGTLANYPGGRKIAVLGDMRELGAYTEAAHQKIGAVIEKLGSIDAVYTVGSLASSIPGATARFSNSAEAAKFVKFELDMRRDDVFLVKGSRAVAMELVVQSLVTGKGLEQTAE